MRALRLRLPSPSPHRALAVAGAALVLGAATAPAAQAHGGATLVDGSSGGVTVVVQNTASQTASGGPAVDISTILGGPGTGKAEVVYWIRPASGKTFKVETERDAGDTFHADISTAGRGTVDDWDLSAIVTLSTGKRLRVTNAEGNPPGPSPVARPQTPARDRQDDAPTTPTLTEGNPPPTEPAPSTEDDGGEAVDDISGERDGPPGWAFPSLLALTVIGLGIRAVVVRRRAGTLGD